VMQNIAPNEETQMLTDRFRPGRRTSVNCYLVYSAGRLALIETGSGDYLLPTAGKLQQNLKAACVDPADIDTVILTHMHPDHSAGLTNPKTGEKFFPNAELVVHQNEPKHWQDDSAMGRADERARTLYFQCAREQMAPYHNQMRTFDGAVEVFPGVTSVPLHGHTPGHSGYMIASGGKSLLIWGDIIHVPEVQVPRPEVTMVFDTDPHQAAATRKRTFDMVATDKQLIAGMHVHFPGFAHVVKQGDGYLMLPEAWDQAFGG
jgi:glyoxylase-like metal-dependent hydrolase (beta-lactamase superfamily II)